MKPQQISILVCMAVSAAVIACNSTPKRAATPYAEATAQQPFGYTIEPVEGTSLTQSVTFVGNDATAASDVKAFAVLAAHSFCQKSGESAYVHSSRENQLQQKEALSVDSLALKEPMAGYKYGLPQLTTNKNILTGSSTRRVAVASFYCFDQAHALRGLKAGDKVLAVNGQEIENDEELRLALNAATTGLTAVRVEREGRALNLKLLVADDTPALVATSQTSLVAACGAVASDRRPSLCGPALQQAQDKSLVGQKAAPISTEKKTDKK